VCAFIKHAGLKIEPKIPKFKFVVRKTEVYSKPELDAIFGACRTDRDRLYFTTLLQAGLREQEAMHLEYSNHAFEVG